MTEAGADAAALGIAARLAGTEVRRMRQLGGGRNSRVYRVETDAANFALKLYPPPAEDARDRLGVETTALRWMETHGFTMVPRVVAADREHDAVLLSWAEGDLVREGVGASDIDQACTFCGGCMWPVTRLPYRRIIWRPKHACRPPKSSGNFGLGSFRFDRWTIRP